MSEHFPLSEPVSPPPPASSWMERSLALAARAIGVCNPNPAVGCVIVSSAGELLGEGHTQRVGGPHAEIMALREAERKGADVRGATVYVTLEPCAHFGRTPPCCDALIAAGVGKVVAALQDPNPRVAGQGFARLRASGITVQVGDGAARAAGLNCGFLQRMESGRAWVRVKTAASLDGFTALPDGSSQWITGAAARADGHAWRLRADLVLSGIGTVLADDPLLNVRCGNSTRQPMLAIVDSQLRTPLTARLWQVANRQVLLLCQRPQELPSEQADLQHERRQALEQLGARVLTIPGAAQAESGLDLDAAIQTLGRQPEGINEIHVEAGARLNGGLLAAGLVDEWLIYLAPVMLGGGRPMASRATPLATLAGAPGYRWLEQQMLGKDLRLRLSRAGAAGWAGTSG